MNGALDGLTVIDLTQMLSGPLRLRCCWRTRARGSSRWSRPAERPPGASDPLLEGQTRMEEGGYGSYFASINRNKESHRHRPQGAGGDRLSSSAWRTGGRGDREFPRRRHPTASASTTRLSRRDNPRLVVAALRGFGDPASGESPYANWPAYDPVAQAMGGIMGITGQVPGGAPTKIGPGVGDLVPALFMAFGIVSAVLRARASGEGQFVDVAMVDGVLAICERLVYQHSATGDVPGPEGDGHPLLCPFGLFRAKDGYVSLGVPKDEFWGPFARPSSASRSWAMTRATASTPTASPAATR